MIICEGLSYFQRGKRNRTTPANAQSGRKSKLSIDRCTEYSSRRKSKNKSFKLVNGKNGPTIFLPLNSKIGGQVNNNRPSIGQFLTRKQTRYIYKKTESGEIINMETIQQELEQERQLDRIDDTNGEINPYKELIVNNAEKLEPLMTQMEQWSILSNVLNYIQYDKHPKNYHNMSINAVNKCKNSFDTGKERDVVEFNVGVMPIY